VVFDPETRRATGERAYRTEPVPEEPRPPEAYRSIGVSEILAVDNDRILVVERSFSAGVGNTVRLFLADLRTGDDVTGADALPEDVRPMKKTLMVDLVDLGVDPDNLEGLSFGPRIADGGPTLVLVADNNFQPGEQRNQLLVLAVDGISQPARPRVAAQITGIQGADHTSPMVGMCVCDVEGTVTAILGQESGQAFWVQGLEDDDLRTSEGLFVTALEGLEEVRVGDQVRLDGRIEEPRWRTELPVTRLVADHLEIAGHRRELPPPVVIGLRGRTIPTPNIDNDGLSVFEPENDAIDFFESLEGMRVRIENPVVVGPTSRHGEITVLSDEGTKVGPRNARGGVVLRPKTAHPERIIIDDRLVPGPPAAAVGDVLISPVDGVLHYSYGAFKLLNPEPLEVDRRCVGTVGPTGLKADQTHFTLATFNLENLSAFSSEDKFNGIAEIVVHRMSAPTVLAVQEIQDDSGPSDDGVVNADTTLTRLVTAVADIGGPQYRWVQIDPENNADGGRPGGNIRVALLYDAARVKLAESPHHGPANPWLLDPTNGAFVDSRKPLVVELDVHGERHVVVVCHLRSKGGDDSLFGSRQPPVRWSEDQRGRQTRRIRDLVDDLLGTDPAAKIVVLGDLNDFEFRAPVEVLGKQPMVNLTNRLEESERSTYVFRGNSQVLDHIIVSSALEQGAEIEVVRVNADFPASERVSDHDPVIARFRVR
jgi:hypothetical protein